MILQSLLGFVAALLLAPLLAGVTHRVKALLAGRRGQPVLQLYLDLLKLMRKGSVFSSTTTWLFRAGPVVGLASVLLAMTIVPSAGVPGLVSFTGDFILLAYVLGLARFFTVLAALDTGSSFEGMGASREMLYGMLAEPALVIGLVALGRATHEWSLAGMCHGIGPLGTTGSVSALAAAALALVLLAETCRVPFDDPNTHLELTMIHEVMVLDHSGPDFAFIQYAAALKFWLFGALMAAVLLPPAGNPWLAPAATCAALLVIAALVGIVESVMARVRLTKVPQLLVGAAALAFFALMIQLR